MINLSFLILLILSIRSISSKGRRWNDEECGVPYNKVHMGKRIVGGEPAAPHSWPWQVRLLRYFSNINEQSVRDVCGGTIISREFVITAAHCVWNKEKNESENAEKYLVIAGDHDRLSDWDGETQNISLKRIHIHPHYNPQSSFHDIAILTLATKLKFNANISKCCVSSDPPTENELCFATGWGDTQKASEPRDYLRQVGLPILSTKKCRTDYFGDKIGDGMFCAGFKNGGKDTCQGDSGGPMVCKRKDVWYLTGITSWGVGCAEPHSPGVYTMVNLYLKWIESVVKRYKIMQR